MERVSNKARKPLGKLILVLKTMANFQVKATKILKQILILDLKYVY